MDDIAVMRAELARHFYPEIPATVPDRIVVARWASVMRASSERLEAMILDERTPHWVVDMALDECVTRIELMG